MATPLPGGVKIKFATHLAAELGKHINDGQQLPAVLRNDHSYGTKWWDKWIFGSTIRRFESWRPSQPPPSLPPLAETPPEWPRTSGLSPVTVTPETGLFPG
ncbi:MAG: hypothetical protein QOJ15_5269, partial [Bradyrhizobium sp.]|nr:hypothetical protein [Bradyrhizobium sp.]